MTTTELTELDLEARALALESPRDPGAAATRIAKRHGIGILDIMGPCRLRHVVRARFELYRTLRDFGWSYPAIGKFVGDRDHTTVIAALRKGEAAATVALRQKRWRELRLETHWLGPAGVYVDGLLTPSRMMQHHAETCPRGS